jgi:hypothetical protein
MSISFGWYCLWEDFRLGFSNKPGSRLVSFLIPCQLNIFHNLSDRFSFPNSPGNVIIKKTLTVLYVHSTKKKCAPRIFDSKFQETSDARGYLPVTCRKPLINIIDRRGYSISNRKKTRKIPSVPGAFENFLEPSRPGPGLSSHAKKGSPKKTPKSGPKKWNCQTWDCVEAGLKVSLDPCAKNVAPIFFS